MNEGLRDHAVFEFIEEGYTAVVVVPLKRISSLPKPGERVRILWNDRKEYSAIFLLWVIKKNFLGFIFIDKLY